jgi:hypothetical protein
VVLKVTARLDTLGSFTFEFLPEKHPIPNRCHVHLRWAQEKCPHCGSALMLYYAPTLKHRAGKFALTSKEAHPFVFVSCVKCGLHGMTKGPSVIIDEKSDEDIDPQL